MIAAWKDNAIHTLFLGVASTSVLAVLLIFFFIAREALPFWVTSGTDELLGTSWMPASMVDENYGLLPLISGSLLVTSIAALIAIPTSLCTAIYISELTTKAENQFLKSFIETLAGIPSVVIGFFGLVIVAPVVKEVFGLQSGLTAFTGALLLALMAMPTIISISEDALKSVPKSYLEASLALGASHLETIWKVTVPAALPGITAAIMLGLGRVVGETMVVLMVTGNAALLTFSPFESVRTMTATIAAEMGEVAFGSEHYQALFCVGVVLLVTTFALNLIAQQSLKKYRWE